MTDKTQGKSSGGVEAQMLAFRVTGPNSAGEFWLHIEDDEAGRSCGFNIAAAGNCLGLDLLERAARQSEVKSCEWCGYRVKNPCVSATDRAQCEFG